MAFLHVKSPNGTQNDININELVMKAFLYANTFSLTNHVKTLTSSDDLNTTPNGSYAVHNSSIPENSPFTSSYKVIIFNINSNNKCFLAFTTVMLYTPSIKFRSASGYDTSNVKFSDWCTIPFDYNGLLHAIKIKADDDDSYLALFGEKSNESCAKLYLHGRNHESTARPGKYGTFYLSAQDSNTATSLIGTADGILYWGSDFVDCYKKGNNYITYANGLMICFGTIQNVTTSEATITFPLSFKSLPGVMVSGSGHAHITRSSPSISSVSVKSDSTSGVAVSYIAIGYWK